MEIYKSVLSIFCILTILFSFTSCSSKPTEKENPLDPQKPVTVVLWHYYNGNIKEKFDEIVSEFNETVGMEKGIVVDAQSQGDVDQLATSVQNSVNQAIGSSPMPDLFAAYPDTALTVHKIKGLVNLEQYFTQEELNEYRKEFLEEGNFLFDEGLYIMPIAKSTENLFINKTSWKEFASENSIDDKKLQTWEGLTEAAALYYEKTGKSFFGIDSNANYMIQAAMQLENEIYKYNEDGSAEFNLSKDSAYKIWQNYYVPYINKYFAKTGRFSSDDAKTGSVIAYVGSTAGASYFPTEVTFSQDNIVQIEPLTIAYPHFESGNPVAIQQGAGICMTKSDYAHEYASAEFLKWFTDTKQNVKFAITTGYFPVKNEALSEEILLAALEENNINSESIKSTIKTTSKMFETYELYSNKPFDKSYEMRRFLETSLFDKVTTDLEALDSSNMEMDERAKAIEELTSIPSFEKWYEDLVNNANKILKG